MKLGPQQLNHFLRVKRNFQSLPPLLAEIPSIGEAVDYFCMAHMVTLRGMQFGRIS